MSKLKPMNLLIITSDQHNKGMLGCYGNQYVKTPNLDQLAQEGVVFENAYCNSPLCVPSRASMATGNYASRNGYWDNAYAYGGECPSWGTRLNEQEYPVTTIGKLHFLNDSPKTGFKDQRIPIHIKNGVGDIYGAIRDKEVTRLQFREAINDAGEGESDYIAYDKAIAKQAADYLKNEATKFENPFTLYVSFVTPHFPLIVPKEYLDLYPDKNSIKKPVQFEKENWPHHPLIDDYRRYCGTEDIDEDTAYKALRTYYALCTFMDEQVGTVLDALKKSGLADNTRIIYSSDHGDTMGEHGIYFKSTMYEGSNGVPLIISGPDLPKNTKNKTNVSLVDIYPSVVECVGLDGNSKDKELPGSSLWKYAQGEEDLNRVVFSEYYSFGMYTASFMLRKGTYKYIHYVNERPQLFNLEEDPDELVDLALDSSYQSIIKEMEKELRTIINIEEADVKSKKAQKSLLEKQGGKEEFLKQFNPALFSPIPNIK